MATKIATKRVSHIGCPVGDTLSSPAWLCSRTFLIAPKGVSSDAEITTAVLRRAI